MKYAVIIKHPFRDFDYRVDIVDVPTGTEMSDVQKIIEREMLGPFEVLAITPKLNPNRDISAGLEKIIKATENHIDT